MKGLHSSCIWEVIQVDSALQGRRITLLLILRSLTFLPEKLGDSSLIFNSSRRYEGQAGLMQAYRIYAEIQRYSLSQLQNIEKAHCPVREICEETVYAIDDIKVIELLLQAGIFLRNRICAKGVRTHL